MASALVKSLAPYHFLLYSLLFGSTAYQSFFSSIRAYEHLPYDQFSLLQSQILPPYFRFQTASSVALLATIPVPISAPLGVGALSASAISGLANMLWLQPRTREIAEKRKEQEGIDGRTSREEPKSEKMIAINKEFGKVHGMSLVANGVGFIGMLAYGFALGRKLVRK